MDDDMNATPLSKLPPPMVQSRRPEAPHSLSPGGPSDAARKAKEVNAPTYAELLREMDTVAPLPPQDPAYESYEDHYPDEPRPQEVYEPPQQARQPRREPRQPRPEPPPAPAAMAAAATAPRGGLVWRHRNTILVAVIVMVMVMYGVPKLQIAAPTLFSPMTMYKLNVTGAAVVAASAAGIYATVSTYVL
jgi:hypothetical protein